MLKFPLKSLLLALFVASSLSIFGCGGSSGDTLQDVVENQVRQEQNRGPAPVLSFRVVNTFPHQTDAFTQGLLFENGRLYESTGLVGQSSLREVELSTGTVLRQQNVPNVFGEGLASRNGVLYQLTLDSGQVLLWDRSTFNANSTLSVPSPAWGLTKLAQDSFAFSDGSSTIRFLDPNSMNETGRIQVSDDGVPVDRLNELEFIDGLIYANRFNTDQIVAIDPADGRVAFRIDLGGIIDKEANNLGSNDVLNGIAFDALTGRLFVTGKRWPSLFQIELVQ